ncbi:MAG: uroporphyrinogen decarboxylase family protein [Victivallaceae bacterium]|nr:uroporphyrinogen decarboxylase family protein [Victivallaceae bacterium]
MNSLTRTRRSVRGKTVDRIPVFPILLAPACRIAGVRQYDFFTNSEVLADTLIQARDILGFDGIYVSRDNWVYHEALGGKLEFPKDDESFSKEVLLSRMKDFRSLKVPDPWNAPGMKTVLEAAKRVVEKTDGKYYIQANIDTGPFSLASVLRGAENFIFDLYDENRKDVDDFLRFCTDVVVEYGKAMIDIGVHAIQMGDATASLLGDDLFQNFALPYLNDALERLSGTECDLWVHICGNTKHLLPYLKQLPMEGFELDAMVDMKTARELLGGRIAIKGNIDTSFLLQAGEQEVYDASINLLRRVPHTTGLILSPGCGVPKMTPKKNLIAMLRASQDYKISR